MSLKHSPIWKMLQLSALERRSLILLAICILLKSCAVVFWDVGAVGLLLAQNRMYALGADFIVAGGLVALVGLGLWVVERSKGYGSASAVSICLFGAVALVAWWGFAPMAFVPDGIFIFKYILYLALTLSVWAVIRRFVPLRFTSLRFLFLFCLELVGFAGAGGMTIYAGLSPMGNLMAGVITLTGLTVVLRVIALLTPIPRETFILKNDGIQDAFDRPLVRSILTLSFLGTTARLLAEAALYFKLSETGAAPGTVIGLVWVLFGVMGLVVVGALYHTRYIYTTLAGMFIFGFSVIFTGVEALGHHSGPIASGYLMLLLGEHFYLNGYMRLLPRVLPGGVGARLKKRVLTLTMPLGLVFCGSVCLDLPVSVLPWMLMGVGVALVLETWRTAVLYAQILFRLLEMRVWRNGPLMISYRRIVNFLQKLVEKKSADDSIYALCVLQRANHPAYDKNLVAAFHHPLAEVRLFALRKIRKTYRFAALGPVFQRLMKQDSDRAVRCAALTNLILTAEHPEKYLSYLDHKILRIGAVAGFLARGGDLALSAAGVLQHLCRSKNVRDNLTALDLIAEYPSPAFERLVAGFLKHSSPVVVRRALETAGKLRALQLLNFVFRALDDPELQEDALMALKQYGKAALPPLEKMLMRSETPILRRKLLIHYLGLLPSGEGKLILMRALCLENQKLKKTIIQNIISSGTVWIHSDKKVFLRRSLKQDVERILWLLDLRAQFLNAPTHESEESFGFFLRALQEDIDDTRELILYQLLLLENNAIFIRAVRTLLGDTYDLYAPALGVIQDMLPGHLFQKMRPVLMLPLMPRPKETLTALSPDEAAERLSRVIIDAPYALNHWVRATALCALRRLGSDRGIAVAEAALNDRNPIVLEAAVWALVRLQPDKQALHQRLLALPTSCLAHISLDEILES